MFIRPMLKMPKFDDVEKSFKDKNTGQAVGCLLMILVLAANIVVGGVCCDYTLDYYFGCDVPWWADICIGYIAGAIVAPAAVIAVILKASGVKSPVVNNKPSVEPRQ